MPNQSFIEERMELFSKEAPGYHMDIIGGYDGNSADVIFPVMVKQEDALRFLRQSLELQRERIIEEIEKKSVEELLPIMGDAYKDLSVQVAYKEGYNQALDDLLASLK